jgi:hypothetical protein
MELVLRAMNKWDDSSSEHADIQKFRIFKNLTAEEREEYWYRVYKESWNRSAD